MTELSKDEVVGRVVDGLTGAPLRSVVAVWLDGEVSAHRDLAFRFRYLPGGNREEPLATFLRNVQIRSESEIRSRIERALKRRSKRWDGYAEERARSFQNRAADGITAFSGSMVFVYLHVGVFGYQLLSAGHPLVDDPFPFGLLTMVVSLEAIFLSTFVMISQNRADDRRQVIADHQWELTQVEWKENDELLRLSREVLDLTREVHLLTSEMHRRVSSRQAQ